MRLTRTYPNFVAATSSAIGIFTARRTVVQSAVLRLHVSRLSVRLAVCLSERWLIRIT